MAYSNVDEEQNANTPFDANRAKSRKNKLAAIGSFVSQNQSQVGPNTVATHVGQQNRTVGAVNKAQTDQNALTVQTGAGIQADATKNTTGAGLQVTKTDVPVTGSIDPSKATVNKIYGPADHEYVNAYNEGAVGSLGGDNTSIANTLTVDIENLGKQKDGILARFNTANKALGDNELADIAKLDALIKTAQDKLASNSTTNLAEVGATNALEGEALAQSDALLSGKAGNVGYLQSVFGPGYDAGKFGGLDSQIYNKDINQARDNAKNNTEAMQVAKGGKANAIQGYLQNVKQSKETIDKFSEGFRKSVKDNTTTTRDILKKGEDDVVDQYDIGVKELGKTAKDKQDRNTNIAKDTQEAEKLLGPDFKQYSKDLGNSNGADFSTTQQKSQVSFNDAMRGNVTDTTTGTPAIEKALNRVNELLKSSPNNRVLLQIKKNAEGQLYNSKNEDTVNQRKAAEKAEADRKKRDEDEAYAKRNKPEKEDSASIRRSEEKADRERSSSKDNFASKEKPEKADRSKN